MTLILSREFETAAISHAISVIGLEVNESKVHHKYADLQWKQIRLRHRLATVAYRGPESKATLRKWGEWLISGRHDDNGSCDQHKKNSDLQQVAHFYGLFAVLSQSIKIICPTQCIHGAMGGRECKQYEK